MKLDAYDLWMVKKSLERIEQGDESTISTLKANGYHNVAKEVERISNQQQK